MEIEKEKMRLGNVGVGLAEGGRAKISEGDFARVTKEAAMQGGTKTDCTEFDLIKGRRVR